MKHPAPPQPRHPRLIEFQRLLDLRREARASLHTDAGRAAYLAACAAVLSYR